MPSGRNESHEIHKAKNNPGNYEDQAHPELLLEGHHVVFLGILELGINTLNVKGDEYHADNYPHYVRSRSIKQHQEAEEILYQFENYPHHPDII